MKKSATSAVLAVMVTAMLVGCATNRPLKQLASSMVAIPEQNYMLSKYEVPQALWSLVMWDNPSCSKGEDLPVEYVSWKECKEFIKGLNAIPKVVASGRIYRLPTADEWEYACRFGTEGQSGIIGNGKVFQGVIEEGPRPVGRSEPNVLGLYDMYDNVCEWCEKEPKESLQETHVDGHRRVYCGGSWRSPACFSFSSLRRWGSPDQSEDFIGLRLACDIVK